MNTNVQNWYVNQYPTDNLGWSINDKITFNDVYNCLKQHKDIYELISDGECDSLMRERIFAELADKLNKPYEYIYNLWLNTDFS